MSFIEVLLSINTHSPGEVSVDPGPLAEAGRWEIAAASGAGERSSLTLH